MSFPYNGTNVVAIGTMVGKNINKLINNKKI